MKVALCPRQPHVCDSFYIQCVYFLNQRPLQSASYRSQSHTYAAFQSSHIFLKHNLLPSYGQISSFVQQPITYMMTIFSKHNLRRTYQIACFVQQPITYMIINNFTKHNLLLSHGQIVCFVQQPITYMMTNILLKHNLLPS